MDFILISCIAFAALDVVGIAHALKEHGRWDAVVATIVVPWGLYRGAEKFWHKDSDVGADLNVRYKRFMDRAVAARHRSDPLWGHVKSPSGATDANGRVNSDEGLLRISDDTLVMYAAGKAHLYAALPIDLCAGRPASDANEKRAQQAYAAMDSTTLEDYAVAVISSAAAESEGKQIVPLDSAAADSGAANIRVALGPEKGALLFGVQSDPSRATEEQRCWMSRTLYFQLVTLPPHQGASLMRWLMTPIPLSPTG